MRRLLTSLYWGLTFVSLFGGAFLSRSKTSLQMQKSDNILGQLIIIIKSASHVVSFGRSWKSGDILLCQLREAAVDRGNILIPKHLTLQQRERDWNRNTGARLSLLRVHLCGDLATHADIPFPLLSFLWTDNELLLTRHLGAGWQTPP